MALIGPQSAAAEHRQTDRQSENSVLQQAGNNATTLAPIGSNRQHARGAAYPRCTIASRIHQSLRSVTVHYSQRIYPDHIDRNRHQQSESSPVLCCFIAAAVRLSGQAERAAVARACCRRWPTPPRPVRAVRAVLRAFLVLLLRANPVL